MNKRLSHADREALRAAIDRETRKRLPTRIKIETSLLGLEVENASASSGSTDTRCHRCEQWKPRDAFPPSSNKECRECNTERIRLYRSQNREKLREYSRERRRGGPVTAAAVPEATIPRAPAWTQETAIARIREWAETHNAPPTYNEWERGGEGRPSATTVSALFGSWARGIEKAGFDKPTQGTRYSARKQTQKWLKVPGTGLVYRTTSEMYVAADEVESEGERVADDARYDGDEVKAEKARDESLALAQRIRSAALVIDGEASLDEEPRSEAPASVVLERELAEAIARRDKLSAVVQYLQGRIAEMESA